MTGIILAGGKGSRLGENKALVRIGKKSLIELIVEKIERFFKEIIIVGDLVPKEVLPQIRHIEDIANWGPLGGIYAGLVNSKTDYNFVFACDMPFISRDLVRYMMKEYKGYNITVPKTRDGLHPLHAIYSKTCLLTIEDQILEKDFKVCNLYRVSNLFLRLRVRFIVEREIEKIEGANRSLYSINTRLELDKVREILG